MSAEILSVFVTCAFALAACGSSRVDPGPDLQIVGESLHLRTRDPVPRTSPWFDGTSVSIVAARGETFAFQVLHREAGPVRLAGDLPVRAYSVERVPAKHGSTVGLYGRARGPGDYPDVLVATDVPSTNPAFFELPIPEDAKPSYSLTLEVAGRTIPVSVRVSDVVIPRTATRVWAYYDPRELVWAKLGTGTHDNPSAEERACIATFRDYAVTLTPDLPLTAWPARRELLGDFPYVPVKLDKEHAADDVRGWLTATANSGRVPFAIPIDEPRKPEARARVIKLAQTVRDAGGGPGKFLYAVTDSPRAEYGDLIDLYITLTPKKSDTHVRWTYNGAPPRAGSFVLDAIAPGPRTWGWLGWRWNIPVWYVWDALYWHDRHNRKGAPLPGRPLDIAVDATSFNDGEDHGNLDGVLALPGTAESPCRPTLRLAAIRRGMQDRALLELAARCHPDETNQLVDRLVPNALGDAHPGLSWPTDEARWEDARRQLLELASCK